MASVYRQPRATLSRQDIDGEMEQLAFTCEFGSEADVFRATVLWDKIVVHLERSVKRGRRSQGLRIFVNCFLGSKAVECLVVYLNTILPKTVQRAQVLILCEKLLITGVIQDVRSKEKTAFRENKLYRFTGNHFWEAEVISSQDESLGSLPKSRSDENLAKNPLQSGRRKPHSRGYTSDSTLAPSTHLIGRKKRSLGPMASKATPRSLHAPQQHTRWTRTSYPLTRTPAQQATSRSSLVQSPLQHATSRSSMGRRNRKPVEQGAESSGLLSKRFPFLRKDRPKQVCVSSRETLSTGVPAGARELPESRREPVDQKRYSLQMQDVQSEREKEVMMQSCRHDVRQRLVVINTQCMHRSHSYCSSASLNACAESADSDRKWIVYGFV